MGKTHKQQRKIQQDDSKYFFDVLVRVHGKNPHTETYSINSSHVGVAEQLGFFKEKNQYLDWKPLKGKNFEGGVYDVTKVTKDDKYVYAHVDGSNEPSFSLPKYLYKENPVNNKILFGYRER